MDSTSVIQLTSGEAESFFLKHSSYSSIPLPEYFDFEPLLHEMRVLSGKRAIGGWGGKPEKFFGVNADVLQNKDGRFAFRPYQVIHPLIYSYLVMEIVKPLHWELICRRISSLSVAGCVDCYSVPLRSDSVVSDQAAQILNWWDGVEQESIAASLDFAYVLHTDIVSCYPSIYTHAVSWAIHNKDVAKVRTRRTELFGNEIDYLLRAGRFGQTNGISQGSALMDFVAEIVLAYADGLLEQKLIADNSLKAGRDFRIIRYRDDYRIFSHSQAASEYLLRRLAEVLLEFGFSLGPSKTVGTTEIVRFALKEDKISYLRLNLPKGSLSKRLLVIHRFASENPGGGAVRRLLDELVPNVRKRDIRNDRADVLVAICTDILIRVPSSFPIVAALLSKIFSECERLDLQILFFRMSEKLSDVVGLELIDLWLQRLAIGFDIDHDPKGRLGEAVVDSNFSLWESSWIADSGVRNLLSSSSYISGANPTTVSPIIKPKEYRLFYRDYE